MMEALSYYLTKIKCWPNLPISYTLLLSGGVGGGGLLENINLEEQEIDFPLSSDEEVECAEVHPRIYSEFLSSDSFVRL
jgi:hypothetical protein